ncbi:MAG: hypothetical protein IPQ07_41555 [Myxococcales bacterium]|nr:hypothetical protein [Myxococcales bacterium]
MRRDQLEIGLEREYALHAWTAGTVAYLLANDRLLASFHAHVAADVERHQRWQRMQDDGWRLAPEYSRCLVEISSPPYPRGGWLELLAGFTLLESWLARAAALLTEGSRFDRIECTAEYSLRTDRFVSWEGVFVTEFTELLLDPADENALLGSPNDLPACLVGSAAALGYAGFTSTNATVHPPMRGPADRDLADDAEPLADYFWRLLHVARALEVATPQRHALLREGRLPVAPDPELSIRDALIRWGDPSTARLLDTVSPAPSPAEGVTRFRDLFGQPPSSSFTSEGFHAYSCRPRVVENTMLFELRCFHSGLPLANLAPLLEVDLDRSGAR